MARFDRVIPPGGEGRITLELHTQGYSGFITKSAQVFTNDPDQARVTISLKGTVWTPIEVHPTYVRLRGVQGEEIRETVRLRNKMKGPLSLKVAKVSIPDKVDASLQEKREGRDYELIVRSVARQGGAFAGTITLSTNAPDTEEVVIRVAGYVQGPLEVRPHVIDFGHMIRSRLAQLEKSGVSVSRPVSVVLHQGTDLRIEKSEFEKGLFKVAAVEARSEREVRLKLEPALDRLREGINEDVLRITTNQKDRDKLTVQIQIHIR